MNGSPLGHFPPVTASSDQDSPALRTNQTPHAHKSESKRKSILTFLRRPVSTVEANTDNTISVPHRISVFDTMERRPQRPLGVEELIGDDDVREVDPDLPTVTLIPPDEEGSPVKLFPFPLISPPSLDTQSPPDSPTSSEAPTKRRFPGSGLLTNTNRRPQSLYSSNTAWNGMADGFILPPPKFNRSGAGFNRAGRQSVIMPKSKKEVTAAIQRRISGVEAWDMGYGSTGRPVATMGPGQQGINPARIVEAEEGCVEEVVESLGISKALEEPLPPSSSGSSSSSPLQRDPSTPPPPVEEPQTREAPSAPKSEKSARRRTISLGSAFSVPLFSSASGTGSSPKDSPVSTPLPPVPAIPKDASRTLPRKQKSLRNLFFSSSTPPGYTIPTQPVPSASLKEKKDSKDKLGKKPFMAKSKSKPSLRISTGLKDGKHGDMVNSAPASTAAGRIGLGLGMGEEAQTPNTPALSTGSSETSSYVPECPDTATTITTSTTSEAVFSLAGIPDPEPTPVPGKTGRQKLSKKFSFSNMAVFKKRSSSTPVMSVSLPGTPSSQSALSSSSSSSALPGLDFMGRRNGVPLVPVVPEAYRVQKRKVPETERRELRNVNSEILLDGEFERYQNAEEMAEDGQVKNVMAASLTFSPEGDFASLPEDSSPPRSPTDSPTTTLSSLDPCSVSMTSAEDDDPLDAQFMQLPSPSAINSPTEKTGVRGLEELLAHAPGRKSEVVVVQESRRSLEALVVLGPTPARPIQISSSTGSVTASNSSGSFASCDSSSTLGQSLPLPLPPPRNNLGMDNRRGSAESAESEGTEETDTDGIVTPVQDSVEVFMRERNEREGSTDSTMSTMSDYIASHPILSRKAISALPPTRPLPAAPSDSLGANDKREETIGKSSPNGVPIRGIGMGMGVQAEMGEKIGSMRFDTLGLDFGGWKRHSKAERETQGRGRS